MNEYHQSENINELAAALSKFQGEITNIAKNQTVSIATKSGHRFNFKYADLAEIWNVIRKPLTKNNLSVVQIVTQEAGKPGIITQLMHSSGQYIRSLVSFEGDMSDIKQFGASVTYFRRYCLSGLLGLVSEDDVDGALSDETEKPKKKTPSKNEEQNEQELLKHFVSQFNEPDNINWVKYIGKVKQTLGKSVSEIIERYNEDPKKMTENFQAWVKQQ